MSGMVWASCPTCGPIDVSAADITIVPGAATIDNVYRFQCPSCAAWVMRDAPASVAMTLLQAGSIVECRHPSLALSNRAHPSHRRGAIIDDQEFQDALAKWARESR